MVIEGKARPVSFLRCLAIGGLFLMALVPLSAAPRLSGNVWSRYMTIESLVERGTLSVDRSPLRSISGSPDLIRVGRHFYSDKPPVLSVLASPVYAGLVASGTRFSESAASFVVANQVLVLAVVGLGSALALVALRWILQQAPLAPIAADLLTLAFGFGSLLFVYAATFNNHSVAAGLMTAAYALAMVGDDPDRSRWRIPLAGLLCGLAATIDLPAGGSWILALALALAFRSRRPALLFLAGTLAPLLAHAALQAGITGSPLPVELTPEVFAYEGSYWNSPEGRWIEPGPRWQFALELIFGPGGWLTVTPVLAFGLATAAWLAARPHEPQRPGALVTIAVSLVLFLYYAWGVRRTDFAGQSFGTRHLLAITPVLYAFAVIGAARARRIWLWAVFVILLAGGTVYAVAGHRDPWSRVERRTDPALRWVARATLYPWTSYRR